MKSFIYIIYIYIYIIKRLDETDLLDYYETFS